MAISMYRTLRLHVIVQKNSQITYVVIKMNSYVSNMYVQRRLYNMRLGRRLAEYTF
jgi:hypothetical protein